MKIIEDENGNQLTYYSAEEVQATALQEAERIKAEYEAKIAEKDEHLKTKTNEFLQGKAAQEAKDIERDGKVAEAQRLAEEARAKAVEIESKRTESLKKIAMKQFVGNDDELTAKFEESWNLINLEINGDDDISKKAEMVASLIGINNSNIMGGAGIAMSGGIAPKVSPTEKAKSDADYSQFKSAFGLDEFIPKSE